MTYQMIAFDEPLPPKNLMVVIFGQPGTGKTSLSFTSENPVLMDFDEGLERAVNRKTAVKFDNWIDANTFLDSDDFKGTKCKSLIIDTGGTMLDDFIAHYVIAQDPKNSRGSGDLSLQGYGAIKNVFDQFRSKTKSLGIDVIMVCHTKSVDDGGSQKHVPKMTGGAYDILMAKADLVGYTSMKGNKITLDFNPTNTHTGKNCAQFPIQEVPNYSQPEYGTYLGDLIQKTKDFMTRESESQVKAVELVSDFKVKIAKVKKLDGLDEIKEAMKELSPIYQAQVRQSVDDKFIELWPKKWLKEVKEPQDFDFITDEIKELPKYIASKVRVFVKEHMEKVGVEYDADTKSFIKASNQKEEEGDSNPAEEVKESSDSTENAKEQKEGDKVTSKKGEKLEGSAKMNLDKKEGATEEQMGL